MENNKLEEKINWLLRIYYSANNLPMIKNLHNFKRVDKVIREIEGCGYEFKSFLDYGKDAIMQFACSVQDNEDHTQF